MINSVLKGHISASVTILIWGTTFISTKILLREFTPITILFIRFAIGFLALCIIYPHKTKVGNKRRELVFALAGLCGVTLYYLLENIALSFSTASNVGIIISTAPFFTALFSHSEKKTARFFVGFAMALTGIALISGNGVLNFSPLGDILALLASVVWALYSVLTRKISEYGYNVIQTTRRTFMYGLLFMIPMLFIFDFNLDFHSFSHIPYLINILFLGLCASALCFVTWNSAVKTLGAVKTSIYIYAVPVITVITSVAVLQEPFTPLVFSGIFLTLSGLAISECEKLFKRSNQ